MGDRSAEKDPRSAVRVGIVGDFDRAKHSHWATEAALFHAAARLGVAIEPRWIATDTITADTVSQRLRDVDGIWGAPGSPFVSADGMLCAIEHARNHDVPYLGTCAGFQYALIELTRNVLGLGDADSAENGSESRNIVITPVACSLGARTHGPRMAGSDTVGVAPGSLLAQLCFGNELSAEFFCSYETNADFLARWKDAGMRIAATGSNGELRAFELPAKRFFLATLFQPQLSSSYEAPHPIVSGFLRASAAALR
jgi:CTP synthase (UTP-ammonia lyase)